MTLLDSMTVFDPFFAEFDRLSQRMLGGTDSRSTMGATMPIEVLRRGEDLLVRLDLPGVQPESLHATVEGRILTIEATREVDEQDGDVVFLRGRPYGTVRRQLTLPDNLDVDNVEACYENGVLTVRIPVAEHAKPRRIEVQQGEAAAKQITADAS